MKKSFKRILFLAITAAVVASLGILSAAAADPEPSADAPYASGTVELRKNIAVTDSAYTPEGDYSFYLYSPTDPHDFDMMSGQLNAVIYVYPDKPFVSEAEALAKLTELGLVEIAEKTPAYIVCPNPLNGTTYTEADLNVYYESSFYLAGGKIVSFTPPAGEYARCTYHNMQYIMAEGQGADFVHNVLSQNANRIAGILTFGGEMKADIAKGVALPAYLVNADQNIIDYYKAVNGTDAAKAADHFVNSGYTEKQVIVKDGGDAFTKEVIADAWSSLLSRLTRAPLACDVVANTMDMSEWVLMSWPSYDEIGITVKEHTYNYSGKDYLVYDYVPASYTGDKAVPLVIVLHGLSEDPLCPAATCGWAKKASEEGFIIVAPDYINDLSYEGLSEQPILQVIAETQKTYNIDASRIYMTGFSMGGMNSITNGFANPDVFAAIAPMAGGSSAPDSYFASGAEYDLPVYWMRGSIDGTEAADEAGNIRYAGNFVENFAAYNGITLSGKADYSLNPFGYEPDKETTLVLQDYTYHVHDFYSSKYTNPMIELVCIDGVAHACSNVYADLAWNFMSKFARSADGSLVELVEGEDKPAVESPAEPVTPSEPVESAAETYTVQSGDSLWSISQKFYGTGRKWNSIYEANKAMIKNPNLIFTGQKLNIPKS